MASNESSPVWFITGCSTGFGLEIAKLVLARGWRAVLTARKPEALAGLAAEHSDRALALKLDVTDPADIEQAVAEAETQFGRIDVLVNNAGYEPGPFRTDWAGRSIIESETVIGDYAETAGKRRASTRASSGNQPGDPVRGAQAVIEAVESPEPPLRLLLGAPALNLAYKRLESLKANFDAWKETTLGADYPES